MLAVIFEVWPAEGRAAEYFDLAARLKPDLERIDGFISIERFQSLVTPDKFVSISFWRDEEAISAWRRLEAASGGAEQRACRRVRRLPPARRVSRTRLRHESAQRSTRRQPRRARLGL